MTMSPGRRPNRIGSRSESVNSSPATMRIHAENDERTSHGFIFSPDMNFICTTCGTEYADSAEPPVRCLICEDERQYVGLQGHQWTTLEYLSADHHNRVELEEPDLTSMVTEPKFGIGERAFVVQTPQGNLMWDCISLVDR